MVVHDKKIKKDWGLLVVYGSAHEEHKVEFLTELSDMCGNITYPYIVGGDFNIIRNEKEKNNKSKKRNKNKIKKKEVCGI